MKRILTLFCGLLLCGLTLSAQQNVTVGGVTFYLSDEFAVHGREQLTGEEALMISPKVNPDNNRMVLKLQPDALLGINGLTSEEVYDMLKASVNSLTDIIVNPARKSGWTLDQPYQVTFEDGGDYPKAFASCSGKDKQGELYLLYAEATLVNGFIVSVCAIARGRGPLNDMVAVYHDLSDAIVQAKARPASVRNINLGGYIVGLPDELMISEREPLDSGELCIIVPKDNPDGTDMLYIIVLPDILKGAKASPAELEELLDKATRKLADVIANAYKTGDYRVYFDGDDLYPTSQADFSGKDDNGKTFRCHAETVLINGSVLGACVVSTSERMRTLLNSTYDDANSSVMLNRKYAY